MGVYKSIVATYEELQAIESGPLYTQRLTEEQLAEARAEAYAKGYAEGYAEGANQLAELVNRGYDADTALEMILERYRVLD